MTPSPDRYASPEDHLSPEDQRILDHLVDAGIDPETLASLDDADQARGSKLVGLLALLRDYPVEDGDETLVHVTLAMIDRYEDERAARHSFESHQEEATTRRRIPVPDFVSVAAVILIAVGVLLPTVSFVRQRATDLECANNLRHLGFAFSRYAGDNGGAMPAAVAGVSWDTVANFVNLEPLLGGAYCDRAHVNCPGEHDRGVGIGYSYQSSIPGARLMWGADPRTAVALGDRNPLIDAFRAGNQASAMTISLNHGGRGQNVLSTDGRVIWLDQPVIGGDNIWLPRGELVLRRGATPSLHGDAFLTH